MSFVIEDDELLKNIIYYGVKIWNEMMKIYNEKYLRATIKSSKWLRFSW